MPLTDLLARRAPSAPVAVGAHPDPAVDGPADPAAMPAWKQALLASPQQAAFRQVLLSAEHSDVRTAVLADLSRHTGLPESECLRRCLSWEADSIREWQAGDRSTPAGLQDFYDSVESWGFDLLWYAYLQSEGYGFPASVAVLADLAGATGDLLDLGSGAGVTGQLFDSAGWRVTLADVSPPLLVFAQHRLEHRGVRARYLDLRGEQLPAAAYDVVTALDVLAHVPDLPATARQLHAALRPGGLLYANFDVRPAGPANAWHLYDDDLPLRSAMGRAGLVEVGNLHGVLLVYRRPAPGEPLRRARLRNAVATGAPRQALRRLSRGLRGRPG